MPMHRLYNKRRLCVFAEPFFAAGNFYVYVRMILLKDLYLGCMLSVMKPGYYYQEKIQISGNINREVIFEIRCRSKYEYNEPVREKTSG